MNKTSILVAALLVGSACSFFEKKATVSPIQTEMVVRHASLDLTAEATGVIEPVEIVDIKSKAAGQVMQVAVESGSEVRKGDLLVRIDPREVEQRYTQAKANRDATKARYDLALMNRERNRRLFEEKVLSPQEFQQGASDSASAATSLLSAEAALSIAEQQREDVNIVAPIDGTITEKLIAAGAVIQSSTSGNSAGTNLLRMADLTKVRIRASFNETDIANVRVGLPVDVRVDAFPDETFVGELTKIEPIATVQQSVTMFPVQIAIDNSERRLKPGMNAEVSVKVAEVYDVLAVPSDAIRTTREAAYAAGLLKLNPDTVTKQVESQVATMTGMGAGPVNGEGGPTVGMVSRGDVDLTLVAFQDRQGRGRGGRSGRGGAGLTMPTDAECAPIKAAYDKNPAVKAKVDSVRAAQRAARGQQGGNRGGQGGQQQGGERGTPGQGQRPQSPFQIALNELHTSLGVDPSLANRCALLLSAGQAGRGGPTTGGTTRNAGTSTAAQSPAGGGRGQPGAGAGGFGANGRARGGGAAQLRLVFVADSAKGGWKYSPRVIRPGLVRYDYTEVLDGLQEGERVVLMQSAVLAAEQERNRANAAARAGGPLGQPGAGGPGGPGGGRGGFGGGGERGGGGGGGGGGRGGRGGGN